jgi:hypothetical protein
LLMEARGQFGEQWDNLHPAHQEVVPRDRFIACGRPSALSEITIILELNEDTQVSRLGNMETRIVTYSATRNGESVVDALRMVSYAGDWRWVMDATSLDVYEAGRCP